jgi:hypothetical protein
MVQSRMQPILRLHAFSGKSDSARAPFLRFAQSSTVVGMAEALAMVIIGDEPEVLIIHSEAFHDASQGRDGKESKGIEETRTELAS